MQTAVISQTASVEIFVSYTKTADTNNRHSTLKIFLPMNANNRTIKINTEEKNILSSLFNDEEYLAENPDVAAAGIDPLEHYLTFGFAEERSIGDNFDPDYYLTRNPDVAAAGIDPLEHYLTSGFTEGRLAKNNFSIEILYRAGTENFTPEMKAEIEAAADTWEDAILQSTFKRGHTLEIFVGGRELEERNIQDEADPFNGKAPVAQAALLPDGLKIDVNGNSLPTKGVSIINTNADKLQELEDNPDLFNKVMVHEFGHVMGIGGLWQENDLIEPITGVYRSDTNAGEAYHRLYNTDGDIPLATDGESGISGHWDEEIFGNELMTPQKESLGISMPLSEITLGSLEDIGWNVFEGAAEPFPDFDTNASLGFNPL